MMNGADAKPSVQNGSATAQPSVGELPLTPEQYQALGWRIFPVKPDSKEPAVTDWKDGAPVAMGQNIGVVTGKPSGILVLDVDEKHNGWAGLIELEEQYGKLPDTLHSVTANGGAHYFFRHPGGRDIRNGARVYGKPGLDIRGDGGLVVLPPSRIGSGAYHWDVESPTIIADAPEWLVTHGENRVRAVELGPDTAFPEGTRNDSLHRIASALRHFGTPPDVLERTLLDINASKCKPPLEEREVKIIAQSAGRYPQEHKPEAPPRPVSLSMRASDFVNMEVKPVKWLIQGIWPEEGIGFIRGLGKSFKSFLSLELGYSLAVGAKFLERFNVPEPRKVLLVQQESALGAYQVRVGNMAKRLGEADNLYIVSNKHLSLESKADLERLENEIIKVQPAFVILDPLASFIHGDENSAQHMGEVVGTLRKLRDDHGCAICVVAHDRKDGTSMRGSTALYNAAEVIIKMQRTPDRASLSSDVDIELKEGEGPLPFTVSLDSQTTALRIGEWSPEDVATAEEAPIDYEQMSMDNYYSDEEDPYERDR